jgi:CHAD domain-containing protein
MLTTFTHPDLSPDAVASVLTAAGFEVTAALPSHRVVLDTFDGRLSAAGLRLEHHRTDEMSLILRDATGAPPARLVGATPPRWPAGLPAGPLRTRVLAVTMERALVPLLNVRSQVHRAASRDRRGKATVVAELHEAVDGDGGTTWLLEVHPVTGHDDDDRRITTRLLSLGFESHHGDVATVVAAMRGVSLVGTSSSPTVALDPKEPALAGFRRVLGNLASTIEANRQGTIDDIDEEFLHDLRVAVRRTRTVLKEGKGVLPAPVRHRFQEVFGRLGQQTGPARDLDVYIVGWDDYVAPLGLTADPGLTKVRAEIERQRAAAHRTLSKILASDESRHELDEWRAWLEDTTLEASSSRSLGAVVAKRIERAQEKVLTDGRAIGPDAPGERLHDLRKDTKRLRYLLECFGSLFPSEDRKAFVNQLKDLQDNLGAHQDAEVHLAQLRSLAHDLHQRSVVDTDAVLAMGRLSDQLERVRAEERAAFAARFARYDRKRNRRALQALLDEVRHG